MKLAVSQIAWLPEQDEAALLVLQKAGLQGLEMAPTRVAGDAPYTKPEKAAQFAARMQAEFGLTVCSMQSIWFGQAGNMFGPERDALLQYTKEAVVFAQAAGAGNLVFGCPKNRNKPEGVPDEAAVLFFKEVAGFAAQHKTVLALEANPPVYGTNFMNRTQDALAVAKQVASPGCKLNLDMGTLLINEDPLKMLEGRVAEINHVHISEPGLAMIEKRAQHKELAAVLRNEEYSGYVSVEMKQQPIENLCIAVSYLQEVFG